MAPLARVRLEPAVLTEVIRHGIVAITEEMKTNLLRTAYNMIIYEALDFTVGLFDANGQTLSIGLGLPMFIRGMSETLKAELEHIADIRPGDTLVTNDAYITGSHLNHVTVSAPVFLRGELIGFTVSMAHWQDIGGTLDGVTTDIFSEGLQIPILKLHREGIPNQDLLDMIRMNVRFPERALGDLRAQVAAVTTGAQRYAALHERHGHGEVDESLRRLMSHSEAGARAAVRAIPDGRYAAEAFMDDDGIEIGRPIPIRVTVEISGDSMVVDLTDVDNSVKGFFNSGATTARAAAQVAFKCLTSPLEFPINDGAFRPLTVVIPPGRIVSAERPAAMRWWMTVPMTIVDTIFRALAPAIPKSVIAGHHADLIVAGMHGVDPRTQQFYLHLGGLIGGGWGAKWSEDGANATVAINDGDTHNPPTEQTEARYPLRIERYELRTDSGGPGRFRGGLGAEQVIRFLGPSTINTQVERVQCPPWGLMGGDAGIGNGVGVEVDGQGREFTNGKVLGLKLRPGDAVVLRSGGGGGFGDPLDRDPASVGRDVVQGYVSRAAAEHRYGVLMTDSGEVDGPQTVRTRAHLGRGGRSNDAA